MRHSPQVASHWNKINTNAALFHRVDTLMQKADTLGLTAEQKRAVLLQWKDQLQQLQAADDEVCTEAKRPRALRRTY